MFRRCDGVKGTFVCCLVCLGCQEVDADTAETDEFDTDLVDTAETDGWQPTDNCDIEGHIFLSVDELECGLGENGVVTCHWQIFFEEGSWDWYYSDVAESGAYVCDQGQLSTESQLGGTFDLGDRTLLWNGILYE